MGNRLIFLYHVVFSRKALTLGGMPKRDCHPVQAHNSVEYRNGENQKKV